jgi:hypothetical protein
MKILLQNLHSRPYSLDIGDWDYGAMVRPLLQPFEQAGDTVDIGDRVDPYDLNIQKFIRGLVVPKGSVGIVTSVPGGYSVIGNPIGQLKVTFIGEVDDLVFLFAGTAGSLTPADHDALRQLIHFIDEGPGDGFPPGSFKVVTGGLFPTDITWWDSDPNVNPGAKKIVQKAINRGPPATIILPTPITWTMYAADGVTVLQQIRDDINYSGVAEVSRERTVLV